MSDLNRLIEFFDRISLEDRLYFHIPDAYGKSSYEFQWDRKSSIQPWKVRLLGHSNWHHFSSSALQEFIVNEKIDVEKLSRELAANLLNQAVFARTLTRGVEELLGKERVDEAEQQTLSFVEQLKNMATTTLSSRISTGADEQLSAKSTPSKKPAKKGILRVVKSSAD